MRHLPAIVHAQRMLLRRGARTFVRANAVMLRAQMAARRTLAGRLYRTMSDVDVMATRRSDRAFVFGSGYSLNDLQPDEWASISRDQTIGFNAFVHQRWVRTDYHIVRSWSESARLGAVTTAWGDFGSLVAANPHYADTTFVYQDDYTAAFSHTLIANGGLPANARLYGYRTNYERTLPTMQFSEGLVHAKATLCDAVNFAVCMGFAEIVLVGVDLYDTRYFWLPADKTYTVEPTTGRVLASQVADRGQRFDQPHSTATNGIVGLMEQWYLYLRDRHVQLSVYNPKSLLAAVMPTYSRAQA